MQSYPLVSDYKNAVIDTESFAQLKHLEPHYVGHSLYFASGGPAVVFKMKDSRTGEYYALKCFTKEQTSRTRHFEAISQYLLTLRSPYFIPYTYYEKEIWVNDAEYPALCMPWIEGETLSFHIAKLCNNGNQKALAGVAARFDHMALWLLDQNLAHGDLKPDNIIVTPEGKLMLVDYDGMFVPSLQNANSLELGTAEYRHPKRSPNDFNRHLDDFPILVLSLSLHALAKAPDLYTKAHGGDALLFKPEDYKNLLAFQHLAFFQNNANDEVLYSRFSMLMYSVVQPVIELVGLRELLELTASDEIEDAGWVQNEDGTWVDSYGAKFSEDKEWLLKVPQDIVEYVIPDSVVYIDEWAFRGCVSLASLSIPDSIKNFEGAVISECNCLINIIVDNEYVFENRVLYNKNKSQIIFVLSNVQEIIIPNSVTHINDGAFLRRASLTSVFIPDSVIKIGHSAFSGCSSLTLITIPESVTEIESGTFEDCTSLTSIFIPKSITEIQGACDGGRWMDKCGGAFSGCISLKSIIIPDSVASIANGAFTNCTSLTSITIPKHQRGIGPSTFAGCTSLTSITIPDSVTGIGHAAFSDCTSLTSVIIPDSVTEIEGGAFSGCTSLVSAIVPNSVEWFEKRTFAGCTSLESIIIPKVGDYTFLRCTSLTSVTISSVTEIGREAFSGCTALTSVVISDSVWGIAFGAFLGCTSLRSIHIPNSVKKIAVRAFSVCTSLTSIAIPDSVTEIAGGTFERCTALTSIAIPDSVTKIGEGAFYKCTSLTSIAIPNSVTEIEERAFQGCTALTSITIPDSVTEIGKEAFKGCTSLMSIRVPASVYIVNNAFESWTVITLAPVADIKDGEWIQNKDGTWLDSYGVWFSEDKKMLLRAPKDIMKYVIPNSVTWIDKNAFKDCTSLAYITIPESVITIYSCAFCNCISLTSILIPNSVIKIYYGVFEGCISISSLIIHDSVTEIGNKAFKNCTSLKNVTIIGRNTHIAETAFEGCSDLEYITIAGNIQLLENMHYENTRNSNSTEKSSTTEDLFILLCIPAIIILIISCLSSIF